MKAIACIIITLSIFLISCKSESESIVEPIFYPEESGANREVSASFGFDSINDYINEIDSASKLLSIYCVDINYQGNGSFWTYNYLSNNYDSIYSFIFEMGSDYIYVGVDTTENDQVGGSIITTSWIDSDKALEIAEKNGGSQFRNENVDCKISASISEAVVPNSFPIWSIKYYVYEKWITFRINANNGDFYQKIYGIRVPLGG